MSLYGALDKTKHLSEFGDPLVAESGVLSAATRQRTAAANLLKAGVTWSGQSPANDILDFSGVVLTAGKSALLAGSTGTPVDLGTGAHNFAGIWATSSATAGNDARAIYARLYFTGAGGGEALRAYGTVNNATVAVGDTVNGAHISLLVSGASGAVSGAGNALRATLELGAGTNPGGTLACAQIDTSIAADATIPAATAFIRFDNVGSKKLAYAFRFDNPDTTDMFTAAGTGANSAAVATGGVASKALKVRVDGTDYWIGLFSSNA